MLSSLRRKSARRRIAAARQHRLESLETRCVLAGEPLLISEFMAANASVLADRYREYSDWIEVYNPTDTAVNLDGWYLTDDATTLDKWRFPELTVGAKEALVVFASGRDRTTASQAHTNFQLSTDGEYLALVRPDGTIAHQYAPTYPPQRGDVSFGIPFDEQGPRLGEQHYFVASTPGAANGTGVLGFASDTVASMPRGFYDQPLEVSLFSSTPLGQIHYTTDGSAPSRENGTLYTAPITVATTTTLRAAAFAEGYADGKPMTQTYIFLDDVLKQDGAGLPEQWGYFDDQGPPRPARMKANYEVDPDVVDDPAYHDTIKDDLRSVPTLSIVMDPDDLWDFDTGLYMNPMLTGTEWERPVSLEWINTDGDTGFEALAGIKVHGGWARRFSQTAKLSFRVVFQGQYGEPTLKYPMFGPDAAQEFDEIVLRGGFNDSWRVSESTNTYMQDPWTRQAQIDMGGYAPRHTWVHLYLNGLYWGLYNPTERADALWAATYQGGDASEYDVINTGGNVVDGDATAWNQLNRALAPTRFDYETIKEMVDIEDFIDYMIVNQYIGNWDWPHNNWFASRRRVEGAKWHFHSWDAEAAFQSGVSVDRVNPNNGNIAASVGPSNLYLALVNVPEFQRLYADRVYKHFFGDGALTVEANIQRLQSIAADIDRAIVGESARWGDGKDNTGRPATRDRAWIPRVNSLINSHFPGRHNRILDQFRAVGLYGDIDPPTFAPWGGHVTGDTDIQLTSVDGDIYYTIDGTDPLTLAGQPTPSAIRLNSVDLVDANSPAKLLVPAGTADENGWQLLGFDDTGWMNGQAAFGYDTGVSEDPITVPQGFDVREIVSTARLNSMADAEAVLAGENQDRTVTETGVPVINYHELGRDAHFGDSLAFPVGGSDFVLDIHGKLVVNRAGTYTFGVTSNDGAKLLLDGNVLYADTDRHSTKDTFVTAELTAGEHDVNLVMFQRTSTALLEFYYAVGEKTEFDDDFLLVGDVQNRPLDPLIRTDLRASMLGRNASAYARIPFTVDDVANVDRMQLRLFYDDGFVAYLNGTEIARAAAPQDTPHDAAASAARGDIYVLQQQFFDIANFKDALVNGPNVLAIHGLNLANSDPDLLFAPQLVAFPPSSSFRLNDSALVKARVVSAGDWSAVTEANFSLTQPASGANLRISEIHYHPAAPSEAEIGAGFGDADDFEFVELVNISDQPIDLSGVRLRQVESNGEIQGVGFDFDSSDFRQLDPGQYVLVVEDRTAFEFRYGTQLPVAGQWTGGLGNSSETVMLTAGDETIHQFAYRDQWYPVTDGNGPSLERIDPTEANLDGWTTSAGWRASYVVGGTPGRSGGFRPGDANRDGVFDTRDLLLILQTNEFEDDLANNSTWEDGDWNGDGEFTTQDLVLAFATTPYEGTDPRPAVAAAVAAAVADELNWIDEAKQPLRRPSTVSSENSL